MCGMPQFVRPGSPGRYEAGVEQVAVKRAESGRREGADVGVGVGRFRTLSLSGVLLEGHDAAALVLAVRLINTNFTDRLAAPAHED